MSVHAINEAERTRESNSLRERALGSRLLRAELLAGGGFLVAALALALTAGVESFPPGTALIYVVGIAVAGNARFDVGAGFTVPTQAVFVPMLFALPTSLVPLLVPLALALGMLPDVLRGRIAPSWLITAAGNSWFALGPALVLVLAHDQSPDGRAGVLIAALAAQFALDFLAAASRDRLLGDQLSLGDLAREVAPIYATDLALSSLGLAVALAAAAGFGVWPVILVAPLFGVLRVFSRERGERLHQMAELNDAYQGTALLLGDVVEADDSYTGEHSKGVVRLSLEVAGALGLDPDRLRNVEFGALLHDVGKLRVPNEIINKPGRLTEREWEIVKGHTIEGEQMLTKIGGFMTEIGLIVRASHEDWDGGGYPDGLRGDEIPIEARIVTACDAFNAMTTTRSYRQAMSEADAVEEMRRCAGSQFDPAVVEALLGVLHGGEQGAPADRPRPAGRIDSEAVPAAQEWGTSERSTAVIAAMAELAVDLGANVQPGQLVEVSGEIGQLELVRAIVAAAYRRGAAHVDVQIADPLAQFARLTAAGADLDHVASWERRRVSDLGTAGGASILVAGPSFPGLFDQLDPASVARAALGPSAQWREALRRINWTIVPGATEGWAAEQRPQLAKDEALAMLWSDLAHVCRLDEDDPVAAWRRRLAILGARAEWLTGLGLGAVRLAGPGTDLWIGLPDDVRWAQAEMTSAEGVVYLPNIPTEEVYTTPDPGRVDGVARLTKPIVIGGRRIGGVELRFEAGRVVALDGPPEAAALREFIGRDAGAARLGELALVDGESRVGGLDWTFGEILLDENAASHIALGYGFPALVPDSGRAHVNSSEHHLDLMIGSPELEVIGVDGDGAEHTILQGGRWSAPIGHPVPESDLLAIGRGPGGRGEN